MSRRMLLGMVAVLVALAALALIRARTPGDQPSASFCRLYMGIDDMVAQLERGLEGRAEPDDLPVSNFQNLQRLVWSDAVAEGGPAETDGPAVLIASAVRTAAVDEDPAPLQTPEFRAAVVSVQATARAVCDEPDA